MLLISQPPIISFVPFLGKRGIFRLVPEYCDDEISVCVAAKCHACR
jgi:hypothetical protein